MGNGGGKCVILIPKLDLLPLVNVATKRSVGLDLGPNCCKYHQTTKFAASRQRVKLVNDTW